LVGPKGTGKTTLMLELKTWAEDHGWQVHYHRLSKQDSRFDLNRLKDLGHRAFLLLDSSEQLALLRWALFKWLSRRCGRILVSQHHEYRFPTLLQTKTDVELLADLLTELTQSVPPNEICSELLSCHQSNIREIFHHLYRRAMGLESMRAWNWGWDFIFGD
jgi:hypothetical protein